MTTPTNPRMIAALGALALGSPAWAASVQLKLELPRLNVAQYHKPYVGVWLEKVGDTGWKRSATAAAPPRNWRSGTT
jgi:hypothetical protein